MAKEEAGRGEGRRGTEPEAEAEAEAKAEAEAQLICPYRARLACHTRRGKPVHSTRRGKPVHLTARGSAAKENLHQQTQKELRNPPKRDR